MLRLIAVLLFPFAACGDSGSGARETPGYAGPAEDANRTALEVRLTNAGIFFLRPGEEGAAKFVVPPDHAGVWSMACFLEGHAREGLRGVVVVE